MLALSLRAIQTDVAMAFHRCSEYDARSSQTARGKRAAAGTMRSGIGGCVSLSKKSGGIAKGHSHISGIMAEAVNVLTQPSTPPEVQK